MSKTAIVYVDAFNVYYSFFRKGAEGAPPRAGPELKWLDLYALACTLLPNHGVARVEVFTARIVKKDAKPGEWERQDAYLRALEATPRTHVTYGNFQSDTRWRPRYDPQPGESPRVRVVERREKRSDVNLACALLGDAVDRAADLFAVMSNDSDLSPVLGAARTRYGAMTGVLSPAPKRINGALRAQAKVVQRINLEDMARSQLPDIVHPKNGPPLVRPAEWTART